MQGMQPIQLVNAATFLSTSSFCLTFGHSMSRSDATSCFSSWRPHEFSFYSRIHSRGTSDYSTTTVAYRIARQGLGSTERTCSPLCCRLNDTPMKVLPDNETKRRFAKLNCQSNSRSLVSMFAYSSSFDLTFDASDQILRKRLRAGLGTAAQTQS